MSAHPKLTQPRNRDTVFLMARVADGHGQQQKRYVVRNLSRTGACIAAPTGLYKGQQLVVGIGMIEGVEAEIAWSRGGFAGVRFLEPIDVAQARKHGQTPARRSSDVQVGWLSDTRRPFQRVNG